MKRKSGLFSIVLFFSAILGLFLCVIHLINEVIFKLTGGKNEGNSVWKGAYGDIAFVRRGEGSPLLLVHGIGIGAGCVEWEDNIEALSGTHTVYAIDLPGFGNSEKHKMTYNSYYYACVINGFIREVIGGRTDVAALSAASGIVLAGAAISPDLYDHILVANPYDEGMGAEYKNNGFIKRVLPVPVIGTLVYNYISSRQSVLSYLERLAPSEHGYAEVKCMMQKIYRNAHSSGALNKYSIISLINGYNYTAVYKLLEGCQKQLCVVVSSGSPFPLLAEGERLTIAEINSVDLSPSVYATDKFNELLLGFLDTRRAV